MIGYWIDEERAGRGLATAAVAAILEVAWRELGLHRVEAGTRADNVRVAARAREERLHAGRVAAAPPADRR